MKTINKYLYRCATPAPEQYLPCHCDPMSGTCDESCLNRALNVRCSECPCGPRCTNGPSVSSRVDVRSAGAKGKGLFASELIREGAGVGVYFGEVIDAAELGRRQARGGRHMYYMQLCAGLFVDARNMGSDTRFINHSSRPNCKSEKWAVDGQTWVYIVALRDLAPDTELTFDYRASLPQTLREIVLGVAAQRALRRQLDFSAEAFERAWEEVGCVDFRDEAGMARLAQHIS